jgi:hypothetical protein
MTLYCFQFWEAEFNRNIGGRERRENDEFRKEKEANIILEDITTMKSLTKVSYKELLSL